MCVCVRVCVCVCVCPWFPCLGNESSLNWAVSGLLVQTVFIQGVLERKKNRAECEKELRSAAGDTVQQKFEDICSLDEVKKKNAV